MNRPIRSSRVAARESYSASLEWRGFHTGSYMCCPTAQAERQPCLHRPNQWNQEDGQTVDQHSQRRANFEEVGELILAGSVDHEARRFEWCQVGAARSHRYHHAEGAGINAELDARLH